MLEQSIMRETRAKDDAERWSPEEAKIVAFCNEGSEDGEGEKGGLRWRGGNESVPGDVQSFVKRA